MSQSRKTRGISLGGTLLAISVLVALSFALSSLTVTHLRLAGHGDQSALAANAARSAVSAAISKILSDHKFGKAGSSGQEVRVQTGEAVGLVTFSVKSAQDNGMAFSTNNLAGTVDVTGANGVLVPSATVHIYGVGRIGEAERRIEAVLRVPPFPWAIASGGRIETRNGVVVGALRKGETNPPSDPADLLPADLVANSNGKRAIVLGNDSTVIGDVEAVGQVELGRERMKIDGEVRSGSDPVELPKLDLQTYDPKANGNSFFDLQDGNVAKIVGSARASGDLTFNKPLEISDGLLYVDGDLTLRDGIKGNGLVVVTGDLTITGGNTDLTNPTELGVLSGGRARVHDGGVLRGLIYAEKGLEAARITIIGSLLTGNAATGISLDEVNVYHQEMETEVEGGSQFPSGIFRVGLQEQRGTGPGALWEDVDPNFMQPESSPALPSGQRHAWNMDIRPSPQGGFPLQLRVWSQVGFPPREVGPRTLQNQEELDQFIAEIQSPAESSGLGIAGAQESLIDFSKEQVTTTVSELPPESLGLDRAGGSGRSSLTQPPRVFGLALGQGRKGPGSIGSLNQVVTGISNFIPMEDRIRLISWLER